MANCENFNNNNSYNFEDSKYNLYYINNFDLQN